MSSWLWDPNRSEYYYWAAGEGKWVFQSGLELWPDGRQVEVEATPRTQSVPTAADTLRSSSRPTADGLAQQISNLSLTTNRAPSATSQTPQYAAQQRRQQYEQQAPVASYDFSVTEDCGFSQNYQAQSLSPPAFGSQSSYGSQSAYTLQSAYSSQPTYESQPISLAQSKTRRHGIQREPKNEITDSELYRQGARARLKITGTVGGSRESLDSKYKRRRDPKFFSVGKVFKILWPESEDGQEDEADSFISDTKYDGTSIAKIRWFVVIKSGERECTSLPILTYGGTGVSGSQIAKWQHSIVYSSKTEPKPRRKEEGEGNSMMLSAIKVKPRRKADTMDSMARINYAKIYTIGHDVKVYEFGDVHDRYLAQLVAQWTWVLKQIFSISTQGAAPVEEGDDDDEEEEEGEEEEEVEAEKNEEDVDEESDFYGSRVRRADVRNRW